MAEEYRWATPIILQFMVSDSLPLSRLFNQMVLSQDFGAIKTRYKFTPGDRYGIEGWYSHKLAQDLQKLENDKILAKTKMNEGNRLIDGYELTSKGKSLRRLFSWVINLPQEISQEMTISLAHYYQAKQQEAFHDYFANMDKSLLDETPTDMPHLGEDQWNALRMELHNQRINIGNKVANKIDEHQQKFFSEKPRFTLATYYVNVGGAEFFRLMSELGFGEYTNRDVMTQEGYAEQYRQKIRKEEAETVDDMHQAFYRVLRSRIITTRRKL